MEYVIRVETVGARQLAVARATTPSAALGETIIRLLDKVWPVLRQQRVRTGHNIVVYRDGLLHIEAGVEIFQAFTPTGEVYPSTTPSGEAATTTHFGEYADLSRAYTALQRWSRANGRRTGFPNWEVYGDWSDDPHQRRVDVFQLLQ